MQLFTKPISTGLRPGKLSLFLTLPSSLTHWGRVTHICVRKQTSIGSDNGLLPGRRQAIIWTNAGILSIGPLGTNFSEISIEIHILSFKKMHLKMSSGKWRPFCLGLNVLMWTQEFIHMLQCKTMHGQKPSILLWCQVWIKSFICWRKQAVMNVSPA